MNRNLFFRVFLLLFINLSAVTGYSQFNAFAPGVTFTQIADTLGQSPAITNDTVEGGKLRKLKAAKTFWSARVSQNDNSGINMFEQYRSALSSAVHAKYAGPCSGNGQFRGAWVCTGPDKLDRQAMGYVECIWADPDDPDHLLAGTYGGLFKTVNGGDTWECITDNAPISKGVGGIISSIAVHPTDKKIIYLSTISQFDLNLRILSHWGLSGASILKTTDGGATWCQELVGTSSDPGEAIDFIQKVYFTPDGSHVIVLKEEDIFIGSFNNGCNSTTWQQITNSTNNPLSQYANGSAIWRDLEFVPGDVNANNHFFIASSHYIYAPKAGGVFEVEYSGGNWQISPIISPGKSTNNSIQVSSVLRSEISIPDNSSLFAAFLDPAGDPSENYAFSSGMGTYTPISGPVSHLITAPWDDQEIQDYFSSTFMNGTGRFGSWNVNANGYVVKYDATGNLVFKIAAFGTDLIGASADITSATVVIGGNNVHVVQWSNAKRKNTTDGNINFQIRLYEGNGKIEIVYGPCSLPANTPAASDVEVGLSSGLSYFNKRTTATDWTATSAAAVNTATCLFSHTGGAATIVAPPDGLVFTWTPTLTAGRCIARYDLVNHNWSIVNPNPNYDLNWITGEFAVSRTKVQATPNGPYNYNMYAGGLNIWQSYDGGQNFIDLGNYGGPNTHGDVRGISLHTATNTLRGKDDLVFFATDGGVALKPADKDPLVSQHNTCIDISGEGLTCTTFWGLATSEAGGMITAGAQHQGMFSYEPDKTPKWKAHFYADGATTVFDEADKTTSWGTGWTAKKYYKTAAGGGRKIGNWFEQTGFPNDPEQMDFALPLFADRVTNSQYTGQQDLHRKLNGVTNWNNMSSNTTDPNTNLDLPHFINTHIRNFAFSPFEGPSPVGYVIFEREDINQNPTSTSRNLWRKLSNAPTATFSSVPSPTNGSLPMIDVTLDPSDVQRVWVTMGDIVGASQNGVAKDRVFYSANGGGTWHDVSKGLPDRMPVTNIVFQEGSNNVYCATDVGIFKSDFTNFNPNATLVNGVNPSVEWICFNKLKQASANEFPTVYVTGMKINYCTGKLYVATHGRGIWETNILVDPYPANNPPTYADEYRPVPQEVISATPNNPWTGDKYITTGIKVQSGATLTIGDGGSTPTTIHMPKNGVILVEKGGTLIVDGAAITNSCDQCLWAGISVQGTNYAPQALPYQGLLILKNGAVLEHALNAVGNSFIDDPNRYSNTGGIIEASGTTFKNNVRSAEFLAYYDMQTYNDKSYFRNCTFTIDDAYKGISVNMPFESHVSLWEAHGVEFNGCVFENKFTGSRKYTGNGIYAYNADIDVRPYLSGIINPGNTFQSLKYGIVADGDVLSNTTHSTIIDQNSFEGNSIGIKIINTPHVSAIRNTFTIGNGGGGIEEESCKDNIGIYTLNTPEFRIEENVFNGVTGGNKKADKTLGTLVDNSGKNNKELYKNSYTSLDRGIMARGLNGSYIGKFPADITGLRFICNTFTTNTQDLTVIGNPQKFEGVAYWQGYYMNVGGSWKMVSAGNRFMTSTATHIYNSASNFNYFHNNSVTLPANITGPVTVIVADAANECASRLSSSTNPDYPVELLSDRKIAVKNLFWTSKASRDNRQNDWLGLINDGRPEQEVLDDVSGMSSIDAMTLLLSYAPYVSGGVIKGAASSGVIDKSMLKEVLTENPDVLRNMEITAFLSSNSVPDPLDEGDMDELKDAMETVTARTLLEAEISFHQANMSQAVNMLLTDIKSKEEITEPDSIDLWLDRSGELWAQYQKAYRMFDRGDYGDVEEILTGFIPGNYDLSDYESTEHEALKDILAILKDRKEEDRYFSPLNIDEQSDLDKIKDAELSNASSVAVSILGKWGNITVPCINIPNNPTSRPARQKNTAGKKKKDLLNVYPNPASEYVIFDYQLQDDKDPVQVTISNTLGQQVGSFELKAKATGKYYWDVRRLPPGSYFYKANSIKKDYGSGKLTITR